MGIRWESTREYRGNVGIGLGSPAGQDRIQFAANLDVKVSRGSKSVPVAISSDLSSVPRYGLDLRFL